MRESYESIRKGALSDLATYMDSLDSKRQKLLAYWVRDYVRLLKKEEEFNPKKLLRYKRGSIVKVHLGYRIGSEEGGLHYAIVIDVDNTPGSPTATVIPLTSRKPTTNIANLHPSRLFLGDEIYQALNAKLASSQQEMQQIVTNLTTKLQALEETSLDSSLPDYSVRVSERHTELLVIRQQLGLYEKKKRDAKKVEAEISKMKPGSIALVGQITTVSKIRIYDPVIPSDTLSNIRVSDDTLDKLDSKLKELFTIQK